MAIETMHTWTIGAVEITRIVEVNNWEDDITMLLPDATPETVMAYPWLQPHFATADGNDLSPWLLLLGGLRRRLRRRAADRRIGVGGAQVHRLFSQ